MTTTDRRNNESDKDEEHVDHPVIEKLKKEEKVFQVSIRKRHNGLGLSLAGGRDSDICYGGKSLQLCVSTLNSSSFRHTFD